MIDALDIQDLEVAYGGIRAVRGVSMRVPAGETVCLIGANGAGKTSLMRAISGLVRASSRRIDYFGADIRGRQASSIAIRGLGHVPEGREIFTKLSVEENLRMGGIRLSNREFGRRRDQAYETFPRLRDRRAQLAGLMSGGEQQMLAMARAMVANPRILLLDEPSMGLAPAIVDEIFAVISRMQQARMTLLLVEQNALRALEVSDYAYVMETGSIVLQGPADRLANDPRITAAYLGGDAPA